MGSNVFIWRWARVREMICAGAKNMVARLTFLSGKRRFCSPAVQVKLDEDIKIMDWSICAIMISSLPDDIA